MPAYNEEENIPALLEGMREKTGAIGRSCDVLVTGDGNRDGTGEIVRSYSTNLSLEAFRECNFRKATSEWSASGPSWSISGLSAGRRSAPRLETAGSGLPSRPSVRVTVPANGREVSLHGGVHARADEREMGVAGVNLSTVQIDLDGLWVLLRMVGRPTAISDDPLFASGLPRLLDLLAEHRVCATFFVNAADLDVPAQRALLTRVVEAGHEIANHGLTHRYLTALDRDAKEKELAESTDCLRRFLGAPPRGFRAAGYAVDGDVPVILERLGYAYDSSVFPSSLLPAIAAYQRLIVSPPRPRYSWLAPLLSPPTPYRPATGDLYRRGDARLWEVPVTTLPLVRLPLHFSYGILLGARYLEGGVSWALRRDGIVNFVFHLLDFADCSSDSGLGWLVRGRRSVDERLAAADRVLGVLRHGSEVLATGALCDRLAAAEGAVIR